MQDQREVITLPSGDAQKRFPGCSAPCTGKVKLLNPYTLQAEMRFKGSQTLTRS